MRDLSLSSSQKFFINSFNNDKKLEEVFKNEFYQLYQYGIEPKLFVIGFLSKLLLKCFIELVYASERFLVS